MLLLLSLATSCGTRKGRLLVFGDSISAGAHASESYPKLLAEELGLELKDYSVSSTTIDSAAQIGAIRETKYLAGDRIVFSPGINDALFHGVDPGYLASYEQLLAEALDLLEASGGEAFVGEPLFVQAEGVSAENTRQLAQLNERGHAYAVILRRLLAAKEYKHVRLVESRGQFQPLAQHMHDGVHPNDVGHRALFGIFKQVVF